MVKTVNGRLVSGVRKRSLRVRKRQRRPEHVEGHGCRTPHRYAKLVSRNGGMAAAPYTPRLMAMKQVRFRYIFFFGLFFLLIFGAALQEKTPTFDWPIPGGKTGKAGKNLQVLPYDDLFELVSYMQGTGKALGFSCIYCHNLDDFAIDDRKADKNLHKNAARTMIRMVLNINDYLEKHQFGQGAVSCYMCHRGKMRPPQEASSTDQAKP